MRAFVQPLLDICLSHPWHDAQQKLERREVYARLFPGQKFVEGKLEKLMVEALRLIRIYLTIQHYFRDENQFQQLFDFSEIARIRGLEDRYQQMLAKMQKLQGEAIWKNESYFLRQFLLENAIHDQECLHNHVKGDLNVPNTIFALELHGHLNRLALLNRFLLQQKVAKLEVPETIQVFLEEIDVPARYLDASSSIKVNFTIFNLLKKDNLGFLDVRSLFDLLLLHEKDLNSDSLREFYTYLRNLCVLIFNKDAQNDEINLTLHELYKDNLARGYLHYEGRLHSGTYLAVCNNALWLKNYEWALDFIEKYKQEIIDENETQDYYRLNKAHYFFCVGDYSKCIDLIPPTSVSTTYQLQSKRLELKALFETGSDLFFYRLDSFKMFLFRTSPKLLSDTQRQSNLDFVNLLSQVANSTPGDQRRAEMMAKRVEEKRQAVDWRWLYEKAKALKKR